MDIVLRRFFHGKDSTVGYLHIIDGGFQCFVLEDEKRDKKVRGETRIPAGKYEIKLREEPSKMTMRYREKYDFFTFHLWLQNVKNFNYIYIHSGSYQSHTDGCLLVGFNAVLPKSDSLPENQESMISNSRNAFKQIYKLIQPALRKGEKVSILVLDN